MKKNFCHLLIVTSLLMLAACRRQPAAVVQPQNNPSAHPEELLTAASRRTPLSVPAAPTAPQPSSNLAPVGNPLVTPHKQAVQTPQNNPLIGQPMAQPQASQAHAVPEAPANGHKHHIIAADTSHDPYATKAGFLGKGQTIYSDEHTIDLDDLDAPDGTIEQPKAYFNFEVKNASGTPFYTTCFAYVKVRRFTRWRWRKSPVFKVDPLQAVTISMPTLNDEQDKNNVFGSLGVFASQRDAEKSTYELLPDDRKLDLDLLCDLNGKQVIVGVERYGFKDFYDYDFTEKQAKPTPTKNELDFFVKNMTGKTIHTCAFVYTKKAKGHWIAAIEEKDDMATWRFYKTAVLTIPPGEVGCVDVDTIIPERDRSYTRGYLAVFGPDSAKEAQRSIFETLDDRNKLDLGSLTKRAGKTVLLEVEKYGIENDIIEFTTKPVRWINFKKIAK